MQELILSFYDVDTGGQTQILGLGDKYFYLLSYLVCPKYSFNLHFFDKQDG